MKLEINGLYLFSLGATNKTLQLGYARQNNSCNSDQEVCAGCLATSIPRFQALSEKLLNFKSALQLGTCVTNKFPNLVTFLRIQCLGEV